MTLLHKLVLVLALSNYAVKSEACLNAEDARPLDFEANATSKISLHHVDKGIEWTASANNNKLKPQMLDIIFDDLKSVTSVYSHNDENSISYVTEFRLQFRGREADEEFRDVLAPWGQPRVFLTNHNLDTKTQLRFPMPIMAKVRKHICLSVAEDKDLSHDI